MDGIKASHAGLNKLSGKIKYFVPVYSPPVPGGNGPIKWRGLSDHPPNVVITDEDYYKSPKKTNYPSTQGADS